MLKTGRKSRKLRVRAKVTGTKSRPRLTVFRSNRYVYAQMIDDAAGATLAASKGVDAEKVGVEIAKLASKKKIKEAVFDRNGYRYHGKVKALAEAVREGGIKI